MIRSTVEPASVIGSRIGRCLSHHADGQDSERRWYGHRAGHRDRGSSPVAKATNTINARRVCWLDDSDRRTGNEFAVGGAGASTIDGGTGNDTLAGGNCERCSDRRDDDEPHRRNRGNGSITAVINATGTQLVGGSIFGTDTYSGIEGIQLTGGAAANRFDLAMFTGPVTLVGSTGNDI